MRSAFLCVAVICSACGPLTPQKNDAGTGGGIASAGGGTASGGGGGGTASGGGGGGTASGGGGGTASGGGTATGGGSPTGGGGTTTGGGGGALAPLTWASIGISGTTSSGYIVGLSGSATDLWAVQDTGYLLHSTGGAFSLQFGIQYGANGLYAAGGTVVVIQTRAILTCTGSCNTAAGFTEFALLNSPLNYNLYAEAVCGRGPGDITVIVTDSQNSGQIFHWDGSAWTRTNNNLGLDYPRACWFDAAGALFVAGQDAVVREESGATTTETLSSNFSSYNGGFSVGSTSWVVGSNSYVARRVGSTWTPFSVSTSTSIYAVAGLSENEVYALGYYDSAIGNGYKWNGTALTPMGANALNTGLQSAIRVMHVTAPNELYLGGSTQAGPLIIRGRR